MKKVKILTDYVFKPDISMRITIKSIGGINSTVRDECTFMNIPKVFICLGFLSKKLNLNLTIGRKVV